MTDSKRILSNAGLYAGCATILLGFVFACFSPSHLGFTRLENLILPIGLASLIFYKNIKSEIGFSVALLLFFLLSAVSVLLNDASTVNFSYSLRNFKLLAFFILTVAFAENIQNVIDATIRFSLIAIAIIMALMALFPDGAGGELLSFFSLRNAEDFFAYGTRRFTGTMNNPNDHALLMLCFIAYFLSCRYYKKRKSDLVFVPLAVVLLISAQSRTAFVALALMGLIFFLNNQITRKTILITIGMLIAAAGMIVLLDMNYLLQLFVKNPAEIGELRGRFPAWNYMFEVWKENPVFGKGPFAYNLDHIWPPKAPDSEYLYILASNGAAGFLAYIAVLGYPLLNLWNKRKHVTHALLPIMLMPAFFVIALTNFTILNVRIGVVYAILTALPYSIKKK